MCIRDRHWRECGKRSVSPGGSPSCCTSFRKRGSSAGACSSPNSSILRPRRRRRWRSPKTTLVYPTEMRPILDEAEIHPAVRDKVANYRGNIVKEVQDAVSYTHLRAHETPE